MLVSPASLRYQFCPFGQQRPCAEVQPLDFLEVSFAQGSCPIVQGCLLPLHPLVCCFKQVGTAEVMCDVSRGFFLLLAPISEQAPPFSLCTTFIILPGSWYARVFCWQKMVSFVSASPNCLHCQKGKVLRHVSLQAAHIPLASATAVDCTAALYQGWIQRLGVHHQRQGTAVQILFVGKPLFSPLHLTQLHYCLPSIL